MSKILTQTYLNDELYLNEYAFKILNSSTAPSGIYAEYTFGSDGQNSNTKEIEGRIDAFFTLSKKIEKPIAVISSPPPGAGGHWVFMYFINENNLLYVDPFGAHNPNLEKVIRDLNKNLYVSKTVIQNDGSSCGPISTELCMHFQSKYFFKSDELAAELIQLSSEDGNPIKNVEIAGILSQEILNCTNLGSKDIRQKHHNIYFDKNYIERNHLPINNAIDFLVSKKNYVDLDLESKNKILEKTKREITGLIKNVKDGGQENSVSLLATCLDKSDWQRSYISNADTISKCLSALEKGDKPVLKKAACDIRDLLTQVKFYVDAKYHNNQKKEFDDNIKKIKQYTESANQSQSEIEYLSLNVKTKFSAQNAEPTEKETPEKSSLGLKPKKAEEDVTKGKKFAYLLASAFLFAVTSGAVFIFSDKLTEDVKNPKAIKAIFGAACTLALFSAISVGFVISELVSTQITEPKTQAANSVCR